MATIRRFTMSTIQGSTVTNQNPNQGIVFSQADLPLSIKLENALIAAKRAQEDFLRSLPYATESQAEQCVAAAHSNEIVKVQGLNTIFRLDAAQKKKVGEAREAHGKAATARRDEIAEDVARSQITSWKFKMNKEGQVLGKLSYIAPKRVKAA